MTQKETSTLLLNSPPRHEADEGQFAERMSHVHAEANDEWTRRISNSAGEVRGLIQGIAGRMREVSVGTEDYAAAAQQ